MLCLKAENLVHDHDHDDENENGDDAEQDLYPPQPLVVPISIGNTIQRYILKAKDLLRNGSSSSMSIDESGSSSGLDLDAKDRDGENGSERSGKMHIYKSQLEQDIKILQKQLQEENDLHLALESATKRSTTPIPNSFCQLSYEAQEILANVAVLEITVSKLEEELVALQFQLSQERNERRLAEYRLRQLPSSQSPLTCSPISSKEQIAKPCCKYKQEMDGLLLRTDGMEEWNEESYMEKLSSYPNQLSEEMVLCMRNIFLCLADSSKFSSFECIDLPASPQSHLSHLSHSSILSLSESFANPSLTKSSLEPDPGVLAREMFDPYQVPGKVNWTKYIGSYSMAAEVSWMSVGEKQLEYAAGALKRFRLLVEQLAEVNPASMSSDERLAFWINLYNALIMHAYLAYGVPRSDMKFFSLMQKAAYTIGGHSFSAIDIEYIILKMKPPSHRPQIALVLALHKFKIPEEQRKYSIESPEPLVAFALSNGMHSSPAVRIFRPASVNEDLHNSLKDYVRASVGISSKGKVLVPKLLHCYAKGIVEDSLLPDWICRFLSPEQAAMVRNCSSHRKQRLLSARSFTVLPFDSRFRYLFLMENITSRSSVLKGNEVPQSNHKII